MGSVRKKIHDKYFNQNNECNLFNFRNFISSDENYVYVRNGKE